MALLPEVLIGFMLAGIFSATMSTADSQILACSAAVTQDIVPGWKGSYRASKLATLGVTAMALMIALYANEGVFDLVLIAWSALGATLGPVLILRAFGRVVSGPLALTMMGAGVVVVLLWGASAYAGAVFKLLPGMLVPLLIYAVATAFTARKDRALRPETR
jgi:sodium/proline symporter